MTAISHRNRRVIAAGLLVLAPAVFGRFVAKPLLRTMADTRERLTVEKDLLQRERALAQSRHDLDAAFEEFSGGAAERHERLFPGEPTLATADLVRYVLASGESAGFHVERTSPNRAVALGNGLWELGVEVSAVGDIAGVLTFLRAVEDGSKLVRIERLTLERREAYDYPAAAPDVQVVALKATAIGYGVGSTPPAGDFRLALGEESR